MRRQLNEWLPLDHKYLLKMVFLVVASKEQYAHTVTNNYNEN